jgi:hypothetical protein
MALPFNDNFKNNSGKALDAKCSKVSAGKSVAFASIAEANAAIAPAYRNTLDLVWVMVGGHPKPHSYRGGFLDANLVDVSGWEIAATKAAVSASTQPRQVYVTADEGEGGQPTLYFHTGTVLKLVQILL